MHLSVYAVETALASTEEDGYCFLELKLDLEADVSALLDDIK